MNVLLYTMKIHNSNTKKCANSVISFLHFQVNIQVSIQVYIQVYILSTIYYLVFTIYYLVSIIYYLVSTIYYLLSTIYYLVSTIYYLVSIIYYLVSSIYYLLFTIYFFKNTFLKVKWVLVHYMPNCCVLQSLDCFIQSSFYSIVYGFCVRI